MKKIIILFIASLLLCSCVSQKKQVNNELNIHSDDKKIITINNHRQGGTSTTINIEIADTPAAHYKGLSNRESLCENCGMLFKFNNKQTRTFVMRDMNFPIDIIWVDDSHRQSGTGIIVGIDKDLQPEGSDYKNYYKSPSPVDYVLEVNAGFADKNNIKIKDVVNYSL